MAFVAGIQGEEGGYSFSLEAPLWVLESTGYANIMMTRVHIITAAVFRALRLSGSVAVLSVCYPMWTSLRPTETAIVIPILPMKILRFTEDTKVHWFAQVAQLESGRKEPIPT